MVLCSTITKYTYNNRTNYGVSSTLIHHNDKIMSYTPNLAHHITLRWVKILLFEQACDNNIMNFQAVCSSISGILNCSHTRHCSNQWQTSLTSSFSHSLHIHPVLLHSLPPSHLDLEQCCFSSQLASSSIALLLLTHTVVQLDSISSSAICFIIHSFSSSSNYILIFNNISSLDHDLLRILVKYL